MVDIGRILDGEIAIVTGGGSGIGATICQVLARAGASVVVGDKNFEAATGVAKSIGEKGFNAVPAELDVTSEESTNAVVKTALDTFGGVTILVNNAGIGVSGTILDTSSEDWDEIMAVNVKGIYWMCRAVLPIMMQNRKGQIVNVSSAAALKGLKKRAVYSASKGAVMSLTRALQADVAEYGIRVNCVLPGTIDTPWVARITATEPDPEAARRAMIMRQPIGRLGSPYEVAYAVLYLVSPLSTFSYGSLTVVDGGLTAF